MVQVRIGEIHLLWLASIVFALTACIPNTGTSAVVPNTGSGSSGGSSGGTAPPDTPPAYTGKVTTITWQPDLAGFTQFFTNDSTYIRTNGWSEWTWGAATQQPMSALETQVKKISGDPTMGLGVTFCVQDAGNFYVVYADVTGWYSIGKVVAGSYTSIQAWTNANTGGTVLYQGYGYVNDILVNSNSSTHQFAVSFNGIQTATFTDSSFSGGAFGFVVGISANEDFPTQPVDVRFLQKEPAQ